MLPLVSELLARVPLNAGLWRRVKAYSETDEAKSLTGARKRFLEETLADFRNNGADLPDDQKARLVEVESALAAAAQKFSENVLDSTNAWELVIDDESKLAGLPSSAKAAARESAKAKGLGTDEAPVWRFTLQAPSYIPLLEHVHNDDVRRQVWEGSCGIGRGGDHDNTALVWEILALRQEKAEILGKANFADQACSSGAKRARIIFISRERGCPGNRGRTKIRDLFVRRRQFALGRRLQGFKKRRSVSMPVIGCDPDN